MKNADTMTFRQFLCASCAAAFSPLSRLLPHGVLRIAGFSGWAAPLFALPLLVYLLLAMRRLLSPEGRTIGLAEALELRLGKVAGKAVTILLSIWLLFYGGFLLRSGGERLLSTVYHTGKLWFFLLALICLSTVFAAGRLRWAGRSAAVSLLLTAGALILVLALAIPVIKPEQIWPPDLTRTGPVALASLPVADVLSPWVYFTFLRGNVSEDGHAMRRSLRAILIMLLLALLFLITTIGVMGAELSIRQQYPFFIMIKNLKLFNVMERFDALVLAVWILTDYICIGMSLLSASTALHSVFPKIRRNLLVFPCAAIMSTIGLVMSNNAFKIEFLSDMLIPLMNMTIAFLLLPAISLISGKKLKKLKNKC